MTSGIRSVAASINELRFTIILERIVNILSSGREQFRQSTMKMLAGYGGMWIQWHLPFWVELVLSRNKLFNRLYSRLRDAVVSDSMKMVYFPLPKSACTLFSTFLALNTEKCDDFDPVRQGVHSYRLRNKALQLRDFRILTDPDYFRFTVIRDPHSRLVSAFLDKMVKPLGSGTISEGEGSAITDSSFEAVVESLCRMSDAAIEKHFRPQAAFIRNVPLDHIGVFDELEVTFRLFRERFGIDIEAEVAEKVRSTKRTQYAKGASDEFGYVGDMPVRELAALKQMPPAECFYNDPLHAMVAERYAEDLKIYCEARMQAGLDS